MVCLDRTPEDRVPTRLNNISRIFFALFLVGVPDGLVLCVYIVINTRKGAENPIKTHFSAPVLLEVIPPSWHHQ